jgi:hypothetical protein
MHNVCLNKSETILVYLLTESRITKFQNRTFRYLMSQCLPAISAGSFCFKVGVPVVTGVPAGVFLCCHCLAISAGSFCCKPGVPVVTGVHAGVFLCCHCLPPAISSWSFCCKPGVFVFAGVPGDVFFCCHCLPSNFSMEFLKLVSLLSLSVAISAGRFCFYLESFLSLESLQVSFSAVTVWLL